MQTGFGFNIDLNNTAPATERDYSPLPAGWYPAVLLEFDVKPMKDNVGLSAKVMMKVTEGEFSNRQIRDWLTLVHNTSPQANDIGQSRLRAWCDAVGIPPNLSSADPLIGKTVLVKVKQETGKDWTDKDGVVRKGRLENRIETFKAYGPVPAAVPPTPVQQFTPAALPAATAAVPPAAASGAKPRMPWEKQATA